MTKLGELKKMDLRDVWKHEARNFSNWLMEKENIEMLGEELGIDINPLKTEERDGDFFIDMLAEEANNGAKIIIENQLEGTDHDHLGKIITYASGVSAQYIIWIAKEARDEHRRAVDWLNEHTDESVNIFLVQIELWQIDDSLPAPKFNIISSPNEWAKTVKSDKSPELTDTKLMQKRFWQEFKDYSESNIATYRTRKPRPQHWYDFSIGDSRAHATATINTREEKLACGVWISDSKELYDKLYSQKEDIEREIGENIEWDDKPGKKAKSLIVSIDFDFENEEQWSKGFSWLKEKLEKITRVIPKYM